jgi:hypothetical protein
MKFESKSSKAPLECQNGFRKGRSCIDPLFSKKLLKEKRRDFNSESHLTFLEYVKDFDRVKGETLFEKL